MAETGGSRRGRLDRGVIVDALLELARSHPHDRITFKRLGEALGVDATAMYRHFRNKEELTRAALDRLSGRAASDARASEGSWRDRLGVLTRRIAELALEYPSISMEAVSTDPAGPGDAAADEFVLEMLVEAGLSGDALIRGYAALSGFALAQSAGMARDAVVRRHAARDGAIPWISGFGNTDLAPFPLVRAHREALLAIDGMTVYRAGVDAILDSIAREAARA